MYNATATNKTTVAQADAIFAAIKDKWNQLKAWPDYRGHDEPSLYPKYLHTSVTCGMNKITHPETGVVSYEPWSRNHGSYTPNKKKEKLYA